MRNLEKYKGIIPAFYACYEDDGSVSPERTRKFTRYLIEKGVKGLYVCGSSGECIYQSKEERKLILESVMQEAKGTCGACGCGRHRVHPADLLPSAGSCDRRVLE